MSSAAFPGGVWLTPVHVQIGALIVPHQSGAQIDGLDGEDLRVHQNVLREGNIIPGQRALGILREETAAGPWRGRSDR